MNEERTMETQQSLWRNRRFVALAAAHALTRLGFWMAFLGMMSLASFTLGEGTSGTAFVLATLGAPFVILAPFSGMVVDRTNAKLILAATYVAGAALSLGLVQVTRLWHLVIAAALWGITGTLIFPSLGAMLKRGLVRQDQLPRANSVIQAGWEVTLIAGPALSGYLVEHFSPSTPFYVSAVLYAVGIAVLAIVPALPPDERRVEPGQFVEGIRILFGRPDLRAVALWGGVAASAVWAVLAIEPVFVRDVLHGDPGRLGLIYSIGGVGATAGALLAGSGVFGRRELRGIAIALGLYSAGAFAYGGLARWPAVVPAIVASQMAFTIWVTLTVILLQRRSPADAVGRVLAANRGVEQVFNVAGTLAAGAIAAAIGTRTTIIAAGGIVAGAALVLALRSSALVRAGIDEGEATPVTELQHPPIALEHVD
jgi:predicted MFS family arabinose efflux permease